MYSLILMTAMTTTPSTSDFNGYFRDLFSFRGGTSGSCTGCTGCTGCSGSSSCTGCTGYTSCTGCTGESGFRARLRRLFGGSGCCGGGCCGGGCCGGGCSGSMMVSGCCGGGGCSGSVMLSGCYGGAMPGMPGIPIIYDSAPNAGSPFIPYAPPEAAPAPVPSIIPERNGFRPAAGVQAGTNNGRGAVVIKLPADARLFAGDRPLAMTGQERKFVTPELPVGQDYSYRFRAEYERDGETISVTKRISVRAGATAALEFADFTTARPTPPTPAVPTVPTERPPVIATATAAIKSIPSVLPETATHPAASTPVPHAAPVPVPTPAPAAERATIVVQIPAGAALYIDERRSPSNEPVRSLTTPPLPAGKEFAYLMKAEIVRDGRPETLTQKVSIRAGEKITVDFSGFGQGR